MPLSATFDYVAIVPHDATERRQAWAARSRFRPDRRGHALSDARLVGFNPIVEFADAGLTPSAGWNRGRWLPSIQRSRVTLSAQSKKDATVASASFYVDMGLVNRLEPGDTLHLVRTGSGGLGMSVIRDETLVFAVGAVAAVMLGKDIIARYPGEVMRDVAALFKEAAGASAHAEYQALGFESPFREAPLEIVADGLRRFFCQANVEIGPYRVFMVHGFLPGIPGTEACAAISRVGACSETAANSTAQLLDVGEIETVNW
jgi:hypothetical protein